MGSDLEARRVSHEISRREMFGQRIGGVGDEAKKHDKL